MTVLQDWVLRPMVGLTLAYAPGARFDTYEAGEVNGERAAVVVGEADERVNHLLTLGLVPAPR